MNVLVAISLATGRDYRVGRRSKPSHQPADRSIDAPVGELPGLAEQHRLPVPPGLFYDSVRRSIQRLGKNRPMPFRRIESAPAEEAKWTWRRRCRIRAATSTGASHVQQSPATQADHRAACQVACSLVRSPPTPRPETAFCNVGSFRPGRTSRAARAAFARSSGSG
jgi:hypothetical protein